MWRLGVGYRHEIAGWIDSGAAGVACVEIMAEHFFGDRREDLEALKERHTILVHGLGMSLGTPGKLDAPKLDALVEVVRVANPMWVSEHVAFTRAGGIDLGHLTPVPMTSTALRILVDHAREVSDRCQKRLLLENIATHVRPEGDFAEPDFLNRLCSAAQCALLLDVTNLAVNAKNHGYDPYAWLSQIDPRHVAELHVVGYRIRQGRCHDLHADAVQDDVLELTREVLRHASPEAIVLERDANFPRVSELSNDLSRIEGLRADR